MKKITECIKENKKLSIGILSAVSLVILIIAVLSIGNFNITGNKAKTVSSGVSILNEYVTLGQSEFNRETIDTITSYITSGNTGIYTVGNRYFVVITTGGDSATDIEYKAESTVDGELSIYYKLSNTPDGESKLRYKIIEVSSPDVRVIEESNTASGGTGFKQILVFKYNNEKKIYSIADKQLISGTTWETDGIYMGNFTDGELTSCDVIKSVIIDGCKLKEKIAQSDNLYNVELPSKDIIRVYINKLNIDSKDEVTLRIGYDSVLQGFSGEIMEGYYVEKK